MKFNKKTTKHQTEEVAPETASVERPVADPVNEPQAPKASKPATEPWLPQNAPDSARRKGLLGIDRDKPGFELRWVRFDAVDRRKAQGYTLATPSEFAATPDENGMIRRNELVLMVVRKEEYDARRATVAAQTALQKKSAKREFLEEREKAGRKLGHSIAIRDEDRGEE